ncbi:MAG: ABC transporter substrate-binding protein [Dehalococcoidia bacterium]
MTHTAMIRGLLLLALTLLLLGLSCAQQAGERQRLSIAYLDDPSREAVLYAITEGIVTSDTVEVEVDFLPLGTIIEAAPTKRYDAIEAATVAVPIAASRGLPFIILSQGLENHDGTLLVVARDSSIQSPRDLRDQQIAVSSLGGTFTLETRFVLQERYGLNTSFTGGDVRFIEVPQESVPALLSQGRIAAAVMLHAPAYAIVNDPNFRVLTHITKELQEMTQRGSMNSVIITYPETVEAKGQALAELNRMLAESERYFQEHRERVLAAVAQRRDISPQYLTWWWQLYSYPQGPVDAHGEQVIQTIWEAAQQLGDIQGYPPVQEVLFTPP